MQLHGLHENRDRNELFNSAGDQAALGGLAKCSRQTGTAPAPQKGWAYSRNKVIQPFLLK